MAPQLPAGMNRRWATVASLFLASIWLWVAFDRPYRIPRHAFWNIYSGRPLYSTLPPASRDIFDFPPLDSEPIKSICADTHWNDTLVFTCDESVGGIGNIRNSILNCVRYAISAGASLVVPSIVLRNTTNISHIRTGVTTDLSYMFETQHFLDSLALSCPGLHIYPTIEDARNFETAHEPIHLLPESLAQPVPRTGLAEPEAWREKFYDWLQQHSTPAGDQNTMVVDLGRSYLQYPIYSDGEGFALAFGGILKLRSDTRYLATKVLLKLAEKYNFEMNSSLPTIPNAFFGAHLRTEKDAAEGWPVGDWYYSRFSTQSQLYLEQTSRSKTTVIYVASGDLNEVEKFAEEAASINMAVTTKYALLEASDLEELQSLAWDQQALVDFMVMTKASDFAGIGHSSFAWNIALKRHQYAQKRDHLDGPQIMYDELSVIYGQVRGYPEYAACLWP